MLMKPLDDKTQGKRSRISETRSLVAPTKGWYVGTPMASAPVGTCFQLENAFPELDYVRMRAGALEFARGMTGNVTTLMPWTNGAIRYLFAANAGKIYDVSAGGAVGAALVSGLDPNAIMSFVQFTGLGVQFLICANGINPLQLFNGSSWGTSPAITGLTGSQLSYIWTYRNVLYGIEANSLNVWYLATNAVGGPATIFPMSPFFCKGGKLVAGGAWEQLTSNGVMYNWVVVSSEGEVVTYTGSFAGGSDWTQSGYYKISRPLGQNCLMQAGGDLAILTEDGIIPLSTIQTSDQVALLNKAVTLPIAPAWRDAVIARAGLSGWQIIVWPLRSMAVVNLPKISAADKTQFVANARTGAWSRYVGWDANCWAVSGVGTGVSSLYYGTSDGRVMQAETGGQDDGSSYAMTVFTSYTDMSQTDVQTSGLGQAQSFGQGAFRKHLTMVRPRLQTNFAVTPKVTINVDFDVSIPTAPPPAAGPVTGITGAQWGVAKWGVDVWPTGSAGTSTSGGTFQYQNWIPVFADAQVIGLIIQIGVQSTVTPDIRLTATDVLYETGNVFG